MAPRIGWGWRWGQGLWACAAESPLGDLAVDYFAHGLWSYNLFHRTRVPLLAVFFGVLPDTLSWVPYFFYRLVAGPHSLGKPVVSEIPPWVFTLYNISHSLPVCAGVFALVLIFARRLPIYL